MSPKHQLHLFAFDVTNPPIPKHPVYGFMMPPSWQKIISPWVTEGDYKKVMLLKKLRYDLMQLYPGLLYTRFDEPAIHGHTPTIIADQPIPVDVLARHFTRHFHMQQKSGSFDASDADWVLIPWSSIEHPDDEVYHWLPAYISRHFADQSSPFQRMIYQSSTKQQVLDRELRFYPVFLNGQYGCMTEPYEGFSYAIYFSVQTRAHQPGRKFLHVHPQVHRYVSNPVNDKKSLRSKRDGTVFVRLAPKKGTVPFIPLAIKKSSKPEVIAEWKEKVTLEYLNHFLSQPLELKSLMENPSQYQNPEEKICALLLYNPTFYSSFFKGKVTTGGMGLSERKQMFDLVKEVFPKLEPLDPLQKVKSPRIGYDEFPMTIPHPKVRHLTINCHTSESVFSKLIAEIHKMSKGFTKQRDHVYRLYANGPETVVELKHCPESGVVQEVNSDHPHQTIRRMKSILSENGQAQGALVEIEHKETWAKNPEADPKQALRVAFAECGQLTQFLHGQMNKEKDKDFQFRVKNAFFDLLSDFGIFTHNLIKGRTFEGTWLFVTALRPNGMKEGRVLYARYDGQHYLLRMEGDDGEWRTLPDFITEAGGLKQGRMAKQLSKNKQPEIERTLLQMLQEIKETLTAVFDREPLQQLYSSVRDNQMTDRDWYLKRPELRIQRDRLRFIRLTKDKFVPGYHNDVPGKDYSFTAGLFLSSDRTYYSLGEKPDTHQLATRFTKATNPKEPLPQPNLMEFLPVGQWETGKAEKTVQQLHLWRRANLGYKHHTNDPSPLHRLNTVRKYIEAFLAVDLLQRKREITINGTPERSEHHSIPK